MTGNLEQDAKKYSFLMCPEYHISFRGMSTRLWGSALTKCPVSTRCPLDHRVISPLNFLTLAL